MNNAVSHAVLAIDQAMLPGHPFTAYRDDALFVEDVAIAGLAEAGLTVAAGAVGGVVMKSGPFCPQPVINANATTRAARPCAGVSVGSTPKI